MNNYILKFFLIFVMFFMPCSTVACETHNVSAKSSARDKVTESNKKWITRIPMNENDTWKDMTGKIREAYNLLPDEISNWEGMLLQNESFPHDEVRIRINFWERYTEALYLYLAEDGINICPLVYDADTWNAVTSSSFYIWENISALTDAIYRYLHNEQRCRAVCLYASEEFPVGRYWKGYSEIVNSMAVGRLDIYTQPIIYKEAVPSRINAEKTLKFPSSPPNTSIQIIFP